MEEDTVVSLPRPGSGVTDDPLLTVLREGARRMLMQAIEAEVETFLAAHAGLVDEWGRRRLVHNGHAPERQIQTGIGPVQVRRPRCVTVLPKVVNQSGSPRRSCRPTCAGRRSSRSCCPGST